MKWRVLPPESSLPPHARGCTRVVAQGADSALASPARAGMYLLCGPRLYVRLRFPRTRGDVPCGMGARRSGTGLPPHARGCTVLPRRILAGMGASPARAGMYRCRRSRGSFCGGFPRTRGDVPRPMPDRQRPLELPPHARGCTGKHGGDHRRQEASPARAGMYRRNRSNEQTRPRFPRTRGDVPLQHRPAYGREQLPPHARGCTLGLGRQRMVFPASPACAGMYLVGRAVSSTGDSFPRTRGDVPGRSSPGPASIPLPPHARGCTRSADQRRSGVRASPARAGMYLVALRRQVSLTGFPRTRGDVPVGNLERHFVGGLPPHARGCTLGLAAGSGDARASPARAGMYLGTGSGIRRRSSFPRTRGDVPVDADAQRVEILLPPHARGCTPASRRCRHRPPASPARAGMYRQSAPGDAHVARFPRTRGDVPALALDALGYSELPPHARGCTVRADYPESARLRFPRTRGDVPWASAWERVRYSLPPHARGCTLPARLAIRPDNASPARAGMYPAARCPAASPTCSPPPPPRGTYSV